MQSGNKGLFGQSETSALELCDAYRTLTGTRASIDSRLAALAENDEMREILWQELEAVMTELSGLALELTATPASEPTALRAKAGVLALMLRAGGCWSEAFNPETAALALSIADEVAGQA